MGRLRIALCVLTVVTALSTAAPIDLREDAADAAALRGVLSLAVPGAALEPEQCPDVPCRTLQHGCACNHTKVYKYKDGQTYAECTACDVGWTGKDCGTRIVDCLNDGTRPTLAEPCDCPVPWRGEYCELRDCTNVANGTGPRHLHPPTADGNLCGPLCRDGFSGTRCQLCDRDDACAWGSPGTSVCARSMQPTPSGNTSFECSVDSPSILHLLGGRRKVGAAVSVDCRGLPEPSVTTGVPSSSAPAGACDVAIYRTEPPGRSYIDAFFLCSLSNCTVRTGHAALLDGSGDVATKTRTDGYVMLRAVLEAVLLGAALSFVVNTFTPGAARRGFITKMIALVAAIVLLVMVFIFGADVQELLHPAKGTPSVPIVYDCAESACECGTDPSAEQFAPRCKKSAFDRGFLPLFQHGATFRFDARDNETWMFHQRDLPNPIRLKCRSGNCITQQAAQYVQARTDEQLAASGAPRSSRLGSALIVFFSGLAALAAVLGHYLWCAKRTEVRALEFAEKYLGIPKELILAAEDDDAPPRPSSTRTGLLSPAGQDEDHAGHHSSDDDEMLTHRPSAARPVDTAAASRDEWLHSLKRCFGRWNDAFGRVAGGDPSARPDAFPAEDIWSYAVRDLCYAVPRPETDPEHPPNPAALSAMSPQPAPPVSSDGASAPSAPASAASAARPSIVGRGTPSGPPMKFVLKDVSFTLRSGEAVALMGASGAGKTTLLDLLALRAKSGRMEGRIAVNDEPLLDAAPASEPRSSFARRRPRSGMGGMLLPWAKVSPLCPAAAAFRGLVGYVAQEDTLIPALTVRQTLRFAASLRLPSALSPEVIDFVVDEAVAALRLQRCVDTVVGGDGAGARGLSGGERRRVSIAVELVGFPKVLFLDEPTSGLDATSAQRVMECITDLARSGLDTHAADGAMPTFSPHTTERPFSPASLRRQLGRYASFSPIVVFSIHQPSATVYSLFDKVMLLHRGRMLYFGPAATAVPYIQFRAPTVAPDVNEMSGRRSRGRSPAPAADDDESDVSARLSASANAAAAVGVANPAEFLLEFTERCTAEEIETLEQNPYPQPGTDPTRALLPSTPTSRGPSVISAYDHDDDEEDGAGLGPVTLLSIERHRYRRSGWQQLGTLFSRGWATLVGSYHLVSAHALVTFCIGAMLALLYRSEPLDLPGSLNRAGSLTFLLLVIAFMSLSCLELLLAERKLFALEKERGVYTTGPYLLARLVLDLIPLRVLPTLVVAAVIYGPMGFRVDVAADFVWFLLLLGLFALNTTMTTVNIGLLSPSSGAAALISSVVILWNFVFGGLMIQAKTIPTAFRPFHLFSPFFLAFEALLSNELNGQTCTFAPTDAAGQPSGIRVPLFCAQYLFNLGLDPHNFTRDVALLILWFVVQLAIAGLLFARVRFVR